MICYYELMKILHRNEASKLWCRYWSDMKKEWFKIEVLQDYSGEDDCPSLHAWLKGNKEDSLRLLRADTISWATRLKQKRNQNVLMRRVRVIEKPHTPYTEWELECYRQNNIPSGEQILIVNKDALRDVNLPTGDLMIFDNRRIAICAYDVTGRMVQQTFYDERDDISAFLQLQHKLLGLAHPL